MTGIKTTRAGIRTWLGIGDRQFARWTATMGFPKAAAGKYDRLDISHWILITPKISKDYKIKAQKFIDEHKTRKPEPEKKIRPEKLKLGKKGIKEAVERARQEEIKAHARYERARATDDPFARNLLEEWQKSCDFLAKSEPLLLKFIRDCGEVAPVEDFHKFMAKKIQVIKSAYLNLPSKLAPVLEGKEWPEIQKILEVELEAPLVAISKQ